MTAALVSVLMPCHNAAPYLRTAIESVLAQTWESLELIVVNDGSTDSSLDILRSFKDRRLRVVEQPNAGAAAARNEALQHAQGHFIQYLDADDLIAPDKIERQMGYLVGHPGHIASCEWGRFQSDPSEAKFVCEQIWRDFDPVGFLVASWTGGGMMPAMAWLTPRAAIEKGGPWNEELSLNDDGEYFTRIVLASKGVKFCRGAQCFYRSGWGNTLSGRRDRKALISAFRAADLSSASLLGYMDNPMSRAACAWQFQRFAYDAYPDAVDLVRQAEKRCADLGGSSLKPSGGKVFHFLAATLGWKAARSVQRTWRATLAGRP